MTRSLTTLLLLAASIPAAGQTIEEGEPLFDEASFESVQTKSCGCPECNPSWLVRVGFVAMERRTPDDALLVTAPGLADVRGSDFEFDFQGGLDFTVIDNRLTPCTGVEARYLAVDGSTASTQASTSGAITTIISNVPPTTLVGGYHITADLESTMESFEINLRRQHNNRLTWLLGFRSIEFEESLLMNFDAAAPAVYRTETRNEMYGGQVGAEATFWSRCDGRQIGAVLKAGVYGNTAEQGTRVTQTMVDVFAEERGRETTFVGELGFSATAPIFSTVKLRAGYQILWIENLAMTTDQIEPTSFLSFDGLDTGSGTYYHGGLLAIEGTW